MSEVKTDKVSSITTNGDLTLDPNGTGDTIIASGNLGVGTTSPDHTLTVSASTSPVLEIEQTSGGPFKTNIVLNGNDTEFRGSSGNIEFYTGNDDGASSTERARITNTGALLVGKTTNDSTTVGANIRSDKSFFTSTASEALVLNRDNSDAAGKIVELRQQNATSGIIGTTFTKMYLATGNAGIKFRDDLNAIIPCNNDGSNSDNDLDWGGSSVRWDDIRATNGTIQTSDQNDKQQIASLTTDEITAAKAISKLFKTFKWNDSVTENGDAARTHTGVIAQEVQTAMTDAGLDAANYAFWCSDTWWEVDGETYHTADDAPEGATQRTRLGIRYPELLAFIGAATEQRLADIETRLTALEAE